MAGSCLFSTPAFLVVPCLRVFTLGTWGGRRGSQEGARKGPGAIGAKLRLALFGSCLGALGSAPSAPCCLCCLPACLATRFNLTVFCSLSLSPRLLLEVRAQVCSIFLPLPGGGVCVSPEGIGGLSKICCQKDLAHTEIHPASFSSFGS